MKLWPRALPRKMRFHDLRHATATLLLRAKVDAHRVQRILRHANINTTLGTYGHLDVEDLREAINALPAGPEVPAIEPLVAVGNGPHGAPVVRNIALEN
jgi:integrase